MLLLSLAEHLQVCPWTSPRACPANILSQKATALRPVKTVRIDTVYSLIDFPVSSLFFLLLSCLRHITRLLIGAPLILDAQSHHSYFGNSNVITRRPPIPSGPPGVLSSQHRAPTPILTSCPPILVTFATMKFIGIAHSSDFQS